MTIINSDGKQSAAAVVMIRPVRFASNSQTAVTNAFQSADSGLSAAQAQARALQEFDGLVATLRKAGIQVCVFEDTPQPHTPDAVFPNNWVSFHGNGTVVLFPMMAENRRLERRLDVIDELSDSYGFDVGNIYDLSAHENSGRYLEGTGSMVLDRENRIAYACLSARTDPAVLEEFVRRVPYRIFQFEAFDANSVAVYHTNVMMCIGSGFAVVCSAAVTDVHRREQLLQSLKAGNHEIIDITFQQMGQFAGNMLELENREGEHFLAMSARAERCLEPAQRERLENYVTILSSPVDTIEDLSGGSVRCMLAAVHLPPAEDD